MEVLKSYSEDLRLMMVKAIRDGMPEAVAAQLFGVSLSSAKRYARVAERGASLTSKKAGGRSPKTDETIRK